MAIFWPTIFAGHVGPLEGFCAHIARNVKHSMPSPIYISGERWLPEIIYFVSILFVFMVGKSAIILWTLHQSNHCFVFCCILLLAKHHGAQVHHYCLRICLAHGRSANPVVTTGTCRTGALKPHARQGKRWSRAFKAVVTPATQLIYFRRNSGGPNGKRTPLPPIPHIIST